MLQEYKPKPKKPTSNTEFLNRLMKFSRHGALAELFVLDAVMKHADAVSRADPSMVQGSIVSGRAWVDVAREIKAAFDDFYGQEE